MIAAPSGTTTTTAMLPHRPADALHATQLRRACACAAHVAATDDDARASSSASKDGPLWRLICKQWFIVTVTGGRARSSRAILHVRMSAVRMRRTEDCMMASSLRAQPRRLNVGRGSDEELITLGKRGQRSTAQCSRAGLNRIESSRAKKRRVRRRCDCASLTQVHTHCPSLNQSQ